MLSEAARFSIEFEEVVPKPINAKDWMERMRVPEELRFWITDKIVAGEGRLLEYLQPTGERRRANVLPSGNVKR